MAPSAGGTHSNQFHLFQFLFTRYCVLFISRAASGLSLFCARLIVGGLCGGVGLTLGVSLLDLLRRSMEAAWWAVIIHESLKGEINEELDYHTVNPLSPWAAILLLYKQFLGKISPSHRKAVQKVRDEYVSSHCTEAVGTEWCSIYNSEP
ncbi:hypothetical protein FRC07_000641 [Ceratobasidium sp. 392]|nr:hypothetical protein FRC07_000641 [Ceratobasidium sp. 392]